MMDEWMNAVSELFSPKTKASLQKTKRAVFAQLQHQKCSKKIGSMSYIPNCFSIAYFEVLALCDQKKSPITLKL